MTGIDPEVSPGTVLVVEDEALVALYLTDLLEDLGHPVIGPVPTREAAVQVAAEIPPDIAILDVGLGASGSGIELAGELQEAHGTSIIFLTGRADLLSDPAVLALNPSAVLQKPCPEKELQAALRATKRLPPELD